MSKDIRKEKSKQRNKVPFLILSLVLVAILVVVIGVAVNEKSSNTEQIITTDTQSIDPHNVEKWQEGVIKYNGKYYTYNNHIKTYLFMGIDKDNSEELEVGKGGQSDAMFLLVVNEDEENISVVSIHRNSMTDVNVYGDSGTLIKTVEAQICTQHAFGDGKHLSCSRAADAVSRLFYNIPITGYLSMQMGAISIMNDEVGGVEVEVLDDLVDEDRGVNLKAGETVILTGEEAYVYLRSRDIEEYDSATKRLHRQEQYIAALSEKISESKSKALNIYEAIEDYIVTNIDFAELVVKLDGYEYDESRMYSVSGETRMGEVFEEYYVDDEALYDMIIKLFYKEVSVED